MKAKVEAQPRWPVRGGPAAMQNIIVDDSKVPTAKDATSIFPCGTLFREARFPSEPLVCRNRFCSLLCGLSAQCQVADKGLQQTLRGAWGCSSVATNVNCAPADCSSQSRRKNSPPSMR